MSTMTSIVVAGIAGLFVHTAAIAADPGPPWKPLFNGKNLDGWSAHYASKTADGAPPAASLFEVKNGEIHTYPTQAAGTPQPNAYLLSDADLRDYVISLEYRWGEKKFAPRVDQLRDAGFLYHVHRDNPANWPAGFEAQIQEGDTGDSWAVSAQA